MFQNKTAAQEAAEDFFWRALHTWAKRKKIADVDDSGRVWTDREREGAVLSVHMQQIRQQPPDFTLEEWRSVVDAWYEGRLVSRPTPPPAQPTLF